MNQVALSSMCGFCLDDIPPGSESIAVNLVSLHPRCLPSFRKRQRQLAIQAHVAGQTQVLPQITRAQAALLEELAAQFGCQVALVERIAFQRKWKTDVITSQVPVYKGFMEMLAKSNRESLQPLIDGKFNWFPMDTFDNDGNMVCWVRMDRYPAKALRANVPAARQWFGIMAERLLDHPATYKEGLCACFDFSHFTSENMDSPETIKAFFSTWQQLVPLRLARIIAYKPNPLFGTILSLGRLFMSKKIKERILVLDDLSHMIAPERTPKEFGGKCDANWEGGCEEIYKWFLNTKPYTIAFPK
jgi:hypothetical protein